MEANKLPSMNMDTSETGCCPKFDPQGWQGQTIVFDNKLFLQTQTKSFLHMPLNMGPVFKKMMANVEKVKGFDADAYLILSYDPSAWRTEHYVAVNKDIPGEQMTRLSGTYLTKIFEGPYKNAGKWVKETEQFIKDQGKEMKKLYFFYTTCPKCLKHYGKNYVVAFAQV